jgi:hypothetical protein
MLLFCGFDIKKVNFSEFYMFFNGENKTFALDMFNMLIECGWDIEFLPRSDLDFAKQRREELDQGFLNKVLTQYLDMHKIYEGNK